MSDNHPMRHNTVMVLEAFATAVVDLHDALEVLRYNQLASPHWDDVAYKAARAAVRAARMLEVKEEYR